MRRTPAVLTALVLAVTLAGCAVEISEPDADPSAPAAPSSPARMGTPTPVDAEPEEADIPDASSATVTREDMIASATSTVACTPGLVIDQTGVVVVVEGPCDEVTVNADVAVVVLDDVTRLRVAGTGNAVSALSIETLEVVGDINSVWWRGDAPEVTDTGAGNALEREPA